MKWKEEYVGNPNEVKDHIIQAAGELIKGKLAVDDQQVPVPYGDVECKIKYSEEAGIYEIGIKLTWGEASTEE